MRLMSIAGTLRLFVDVFNRVDFLRRYMRWYAILWIDDDQESRHDKNVFGFQYGVAHAILRPQIKRTKRSVQSSLPYFNRIHADLSESISELERNILRFEIRLQSFMAQFATQTRFLHAAERALRRRGHRIVHADDAGFQAFG